MEISYIILAHKNPLQLWRLIQRLKEPWTKFYIHIDKEIDIRPFITSIPPDDDIQFLQDTKRESGTWGDIGIVKGTLNAMTQIVKENKSGTCVLLSGQDYPLVKNQEIRSFFLKNPKTGFIDLFPVPHKDWVNKGLIRINRYKINKSNNRGHYLFLPSVFEKDFYKTETLGKLNYLRKSGKKKDLLKIFKKRKFPDYLKPYGGSAYFALPTNTVEDILNFIDDHPDYLTYHNYTLSADEVFFHSIIGYLEKQNKIRIKPSLTYVNWSKKESPLPATFNITDFEELEEASKIQLFARKFDYEVDMEILNKIDQELR